MTHKWEQALLVELQTMIQENWVKNTSFHKKAFQCEIILLCSLPLPLEQKDFIKETLERKIELTKVVQKNVKCRHSIRWDGEKLKIST